MKAHPQKTLRLLWWNVCDYAHYERFRAGEDRWPLTSAEYRAKCHRVDRALQAVFRRVGKPHILGLAEVTNQAATELRDRLFHGYTVYSLDLVARPELQVAILYDSALPITEEPPIVVSAVPQGTRPMAVVDFSSGADRIRVICCHWTARFADSSTITRERLASHLASYAYKFLNNQDLAERGHLIIMGDLNEEPYGIPAEYLNGIRSRGRVLEKLHYQDHPQERQRLYNCAWRKLGENRPHDGSSGVRVGDAAGTYYCRDQKTWHTFDQVLASGTLLTRKEPFLDEARLNLLATRSLLSEDGLPLKFDWRGGNPVGLSDHLPIFVPIVVRR